MQGGREGEQQRHSEDLDQWDDFLPLPAEQDSHNRVSQQGKQNQGWPQGGGDQLDRAEITVPETAAFAGLLGERGQRDRSNSGQDNALGKQA